MPPEHCTGTHLAPAQQPGSMAHLCKSPGATFRQASAPLSSNIWTTAAKDAAAVHRWLGSKDSSSCKASEAFLRTSCRLCKAHLQAALASPMEHHTADCADRLLHILLISPVLIIPRSASLQGEAVKAGSSLHLAPLLLWRGAADSMLHWWLICSANCWQPA